MNSLPYAKKSLGQHWLTDDATLAAMCDAAEVKDADTVLEIGPGVGTLTQKLVARAKEVVAVEFDEKLASELPQKIPAPNLTVMHQDIMHFNLAQLPPGYKVCANIPYYLTSNLLRTLSESSNPPVVVALLVQKEVAERVAAKPGGMSLLSVATQWYYQPELRQVVPAALFTPPPRVDSQILKLIRRAEPLFAEIDARQFFRVVKAGFAARRKTLLNSLAGGLRLPKAEAAAILERAGVDPTSRAQNLSLADWLKVYEQAREHIYPQVQG